MTYLTDVLALLWGCLYFFALGLWTLFLKLILPAALILLGIVMLNKSKTEHLQIWRHCGADDAPVTELHSDGIITPHVAVIMRLPAYISSST